VPAWQACIMQAFPLSSYPHDSQPPVSAPHELTCRATRRAAGCGTALSIPSPTITDPDQSPNTCRATRRAVGCGAARPRAAVQRWTQPTWRRGRWWASELSHPPALGRHNGSGTITSCVWVGTPRKVRGSRVAACLPACHERAAYLLASSKALNLPLPSADPLHVRPAPLFSPPLLGRYMAQYEQSINPFAGGRPAVSGGCTWQ